MSTTNCALVVEWGMPKDGRETKALEEFMVHMSWWNQLKSSGKIAEFRTFGPVTGNLAKRAGMAILEGTTKQIQDLHMSEEFRVRLNHASICVNDVRVEICETGDLMTTRMQRFGKSVKDTLG